MRLTPLLWLLAAGLPRTVLAVSLARGPTQELVTTASILLRWRTDLAAAHRLEYGENGTLSYTAVQTGTSTQASFALAGLKPNTWYRYQAVSDGSVLADSVFQTAPDESDRAFDFGVMGDSGSGDANQNAMALRLLARDPEFALHAGDVIYPGGEDVYYDPRYYTPYRDYLKRHPFFPCPGNHDVVSLGGLPYKNNFQTFANNPAADEFYYSFDWGHTHFISLNSNCVAPPCCTACAQKLWHDADLAATVKFWIVPFLHHAPYASGFHGSNLPVRDALAPLWEAEGVGFMFSGHEHHYERTTPRDDYNGPNLGVTYVVTGGGGAGLRAVGASAFTAYSESAFHLTHAYFSGQTAVILAIRADGSLMDYAVEERDPAPRNEVGDTNHDRQTNMEDAAAALHGVLAPSWNPTPGLLALESGTGPLQVADVLRIGRTALGSYDAVVAPALSVTAEPGPVLLADGDPVRWIRFDAASPAGAGFDLTGLRAQAAIVQGGISSALIDAYPFVIDDRIYARLLPINPGPSDESFQVEARIEMFSTDGSLLAAATDRLDVVVAP